MELIRELNRSVNDRKDLFANIKQHENSRDITRQLRLNLDIYFMDIEKNTTTRILPLQKSLIKGFVDTNRVILAPAHERKKMRKDFSNVKRDLITEWEKNTEMKWPKYEKDVYDDRGRLYRQKGANYDLHHIVELSYGGPAKWWNMHPAASPDEHQNGIHRENGVASKIFSADPTKY